MPRRPLHAVAGSAVAPSRRGCGGMSVRWSRAELARRLGSTRMVVGVGSVLVALLAGPAAALATAPGKNGQIAFRRYLGPDRTKGAILVANPDGSGERQLTSAPGKASDDYPDMSPDGSFVAFQRCGKFTCGIYVINTDGSGLRRVDDDCRQLQSSRH